MVLKLLITLLAATVYADPEGHHHLPLFSDHYAGHYHGDHIVQEPLPTFENFLPTEETWCRGGRGRIIGGYQSEPSACASICNEEPLCGGFNLRAVDGICAAYTLGCREDTNTEWTFYRRKTNADSKVEDLAAAAPQQLEEQTTTTAAAATTQQSAHLHETTTFKTAVVEIEAAEKPITAAKVEEATTTTTTTTTTQEAATVTTTTEPTTTTSTTTTQIVEETATANVEDSNRSQKIVVLTMSPPDLGEANEKPITREEYITEPATTTTVVTEASTASTATEEPQVGDVVVAAIPFAKKATASMKFDNNELKESDTTKKADELKLSNNNNEHDPEPPSVVLPTKNIMFGEYQQLAGNCRGGSVLKMFVEVSAKQCADACSSHCSCVGFTYADDSYHCVLKESRCEKPIQHHPNVNYFAHIYRHPQGVSKQQQQQQQQQQEKRI